MNWRNILFYMFAKSMYDCVFIFGQKDIYIFRVIVHQYGIFTSYDHKVITNRFHIDIDDIIEYFFT